MAENEPNGGAPAQSQPTTLNPKVALLAQYVRDLSFENVAAMKGGDTQGRPDIKVAVNLDAKARGEDRYEVSMKLTATATAGETTVFVVELDYAGLFTVTGVPETHMRPFLLIECPRILFPFARRILSDVTRDGGYPPLMLDLIDFAQIYKTEIERRAAQATANA
ncbi:MAG: protein-export chaperone SecB [Rhodobacteraceae bacterium]|nr:MAG: protein-export chaperone SecB [Paracoccaceae bacterium]